MDKNKSISRWGKMVKEKLRLSQSPKPAGEAQKPAVTIIKEEYDGPVYASMEKEKARLSQPMKQSKPPLVTETKIQKPEKKRPDVTEQKMLYTSYGSVRLNSDNTFELAGITFHWHEDRTFDFPYGASVGKLFGRLYVDDDENTTFDKDNYFIEFDSNGVVVDIGWTDGGHDYHHQYPLEEKKHQETTWYGASGMVTIPDGVEQIKDDQFANCIKLTGINIPESVKWIGNHAFYKCTKLGEAMIPNGVTSVGDFAFSDCSSMTSVTLPDSVTSIGDFAFRDCKSLTSVTLPDSITSIGMGAFKDCSSLTSVTIPAGVTSVRDEAFHGCSSLTDVYYGGSAEEGLKIDIGAGNECLINASVHYASKEKENVETVSYESGNGATKVIKQGSCGALLADEPVHKYDDNLQWKLYDDGVLVISGQGEMFSKPGSVIQGSHLPWGTSAECYVSPWADGEPTWEYENVNEVRLTGVVPPCDLKKVVIEDGVTSIGKQAFCGNVDWDWDDTVCVEGNDHPNLTTVIIPASVTWIGENAFQKNDDLTIYASQGSYAENYAKKNNLKFIPIENT